MNCIHFWEIEHGGLGRIKSLGECKYCGKTKEFPNWIDYDGRDIKDIVGEKKGKERGAELWRNTFSLAGSNSAKHTNDEDE